MTSPNEFENNVTPAESPPQRPPAVKAIGWILVGLTAFQTLSALGTIVFFRLMDHLAPGEFPPSAEDLAEMPQGFAGMFKMFEYAEPLSIIQLPIAILVFYASLQFLKQKRWTRPVLEIYSWLWLIYLVVFTIMFTQMYNELLTGIAEANQENTFPEQGAMLTVMMAFGSLFWAAPAIVFIYFLRGKTVRSALYK